MDTETFGPVGRTMQIMPELRWAERRAPIYDKFGDGVVGFNTERTLQQAHRDINSGEIEWFDVPTTRI